MSPITKRYWFLLKHGKRSTVSYLCYAETHRQALDSFGSLVGTGVVVRQKWGELRDITGCLIPSQYKASDLASGNLVFKKGKNIFCLRHNIFWET